MDNGDIKVLLVEDNADDAKFIQNAVAQVGDHRFCLHRVGRLEAGLEHITQKQCDVILWGLSETGGQMLDVITKLHAQLPKVPIVILTSLQQETLAREIVRESAQGYLVKEQLNGNLLIRAIRNAIERQGLVADLKQEIRELQSSQAYFLNIINIITKNADGMVIVDKDGIIRFLNPAAELLFKRKGEELLGEIFGFPLMNGGRTELGIVRPNGEPIIAEMRVVHTEWERKPAYLVSLRDITERKWAEERLHRSEEQFRQFFEDAPVYCYMISREGTILDVNRAATKALGYSKVELVGKPLRMIYSPESLPRAMKSFSQWEENGEIDSEELDIITKESHKRSVLVSTSAVKGENGNILHFISVQRDITERKQAEERLRIQKELTDRILASTPNPVVVVDRHCMIMLANKAFYETFKMKKSESEGRPVSNVLPVEGLNEAISNTLASSQPQLDLEFTYELDTDKMIIVGQLLPMSQQEGQLLLILRDVTAERNMQEQLHHTRMLASIGEMATGVAHEINNPLTSVIGFAQLLAKKDIPEDIRQDINIINDGAQRVASIVKRLLTFACQQKPERGYINVNDVIQVTLNLRKYELETGNIEVVTQLDHELPWTMADAGQLEQVFLNILINAEAAMKSAHGKGKLFVKTEKIEDIIRISFSDDGPGIATENMDKLFNPFFTTKGIGGGTGLGLSICHGIVTEHNGRVYATSELGKGATFTVELPIINQAKQSELSQPADDKSRNITGARILVVDDEAAIRQYLNRLLTNEGFEVQCTDSADDALDKLKNNGYSLILLDIRMPGTSGIEIYKRLQEISRSLTRRVLFITGDVMAPDTKDFFSVTKAPYVSKPFSAEQLKREIGRILDHGK